jgi:hypothetical protein
VDGHFGGNGLIDGNIEADQANGGVADPDHAPGGTIHIAVDVVNSAFLVVNIAYVSGGIQ